MRSRDRRSLTHRSFVLRTSLFNLFYTCDGACFFGVGNTTEIICGKEGLRMGCPFKDSYGFDLALDCAARRNNLHIVRAITDDSVLAVRSSHRLPPT